MTTEKLSDKSRFFHRCNNSDIRLFDASRYYLPFKYYEFIDFVEEDIRLISVKNNTDNEYYSEEIIYYINLQR